MALSWNEIRTRAIAFSKDWEHETSEDAEAKSFLDGFFHIFGITRKRMEYLFELYERYTAGLFTPARKPKASPRQKPK